jgi:hypothetical protein
MLSLKSWPQATEAATEATGTRTFSFQLAGITPSYGQQIPVPFTQRDQHTNAGRVDSLTCWFIDSLISQPRTLKLWSLKISKELNLENSRNMRHRGHGGLRTVLSSASLCYLKRHHIYEKCRKYNGKCCKKYQKVISILLTSLWLDYDNMADKCRL